LEAQSKITLLLRQQLFVSAYSGFQPFHRMKHKGPTGEKPVGLKKIRVVQPEQSRPEGIQIFSSVRPAYRCLPIGSIGGRDTITSEVGLPCTTHDARHASSKKIYRGKQPAKQNPKS